MSSEIKMSVIIDEVLNSQVCDVFEEITIQAKCSIDRDNILKKLRKMNYSDEVIQLAFNKYDDLASSKSQNAIVKGERYKSRLDWYQPDQSPSDDSRWGKLVSVLKSKGWPDSNIEVLNDQSNDVVASLGSPKSIKPDSIKGLVLGYVQSGKTANFSAVIAKATDEGYRLIIVLSGRHNGLRSQTEKRLKSELVTPHGGANSFTLTDVGNNGDFKTPPSHPNSIISNEGKFALVVMKKNSSPLKKFLKWISDADAEILKNCPVLIIDDEADEASVNNSNNEEKPTVINREIRKMIDYFSTITICSYVGYTATPFANILIDADEKSDLFPKDFIISLKAPSTYIGNERLFGRASVDLDGGEEGLDIIREILPTDIIKSDEENVEKKMPESMRRAILTFLLSAGERVRRGHIDEKSHITMLIHTSHLKEQHAVVCELVDVFKGNLDLELGKNSPELLLQFKEIWEKDFIKTNTFCFPTLKLGKFEEVIEGVKHFIGGFQRCIKENSVSDFRLDFDSGRVWGIIVGGNTLSRGLTVEGLTCTYFHRNTDGYDTLLQMGRWFGYRPDYLDLVRVFVTSEMQSNFYHLATVEQELREDIVRMQANEERPIDFALKIRDHDKLSITNKVVFKKNASYASNSFSGAKIQAGHLYLNNEKINSENFKTIKDLVLQCERDNLYSQIKLPTFKKSILYKNLKPEMIIGFLENYHFSPADKKFNKGIIGPYIQDLVKKGELRNWSFGIISLDDTDPKRKIDLGISSLHIYGVKRSYNPRNCANPDELGVAVNIAAPRDELIDLDDIKEIDVEKILMDKATDQISRARNFRPQDRGLLLIYPIYTHWNLSEVEIENIKQGSLSVPVVSKFKNLFGITMVFPTTRLEKFEYNYIENFSIKKNKDVA